MIDASLLQALAFVDLETTGAIAGRDRITEIGIVLVDDHGVREWSRLVNPQTRIPLFIEQMTGITNAMAAEAPPFAAVAEQVTDLLDGRLFIAHNARFDYGFLKNEFQRIGLPFRPKVLCTVKLSRTLFPQYHHHNLDSLIERHSLVVADRHRALADAQLLHQFWKRLYEQFPPTVIEAAIEQSTRRTRLPSHIDPLLIDELPERAGVYWFYGDNDLPLYIGKSVNIRQRVLAHFAADHRHPKEMSLSQQLRRIDWQETAGELGALLLEAKLIKQLQPTHNQRLRRKNALCAWQLIEQNDRLKPVLIWADDLNFGELHNLYGLYHSSKDAQQALRKLAEQHRLCLALLGIEKTAPGRPCFAHQLQKCLGACVGRESQLQHTTRLVSAMQSLKIASWPYPGAIGVREGDELHVLDRWCYLGTAKTEKEAYELLSTAQPIFDRDSYRLLSKTLRKAAIVPLTSHRQ